MDAATHDSRTIAEDANRARSPAVARNFFETWYLKWNHLESETAGWVRYTLSHSTKRQPEASVWGVFIEARRPERTFYAKEDHPRSEVAMSRDPFELSIGASGLRHGETWGEVCGGGAMSWQLRVDGPAEPFNHVPWPLYVGPLPSTKFVAPFCWCTVSGDVVVDGREIRLTSVPAHQAHFWGRKQVTSWTWGNCSTFREDPDLAFEGISGRVALGPLPLPALSSFAFRWEGAVHRSNRLLRTLLNRSVNDLVEWRFEAIAGDLRWVGLLTARPEEMILYRHVDPDGDERHSHNHFFGDLELRVERRCKGGWHELKRFHAERSAAFEVAQPERDARVTRFINP